LIPFWFHPIKTITYESIFRSQLAPLTFSSQLAPLTFSSQLAPLTFSSQLAPLTFGSQFSSAQGCLSYYAISYLTLLCNEEKKLTYACSSFWEGRANPK
jgi:hypothetical protein